MPALVALAWAVCEAAPDAADGAAATDPPRFDIEVSDAPARPFFLGLARRGRENVIVHPQVRGLLTLSLRQVTVLETLEAVRELYGYDFRRVAAGYFVLPASVQTRIFRINYLDMQRSGASRTLVSSGSISDRSRANGFDDSTGFAASADPAGAAASGGAASGDGTRLSGPGMTGTSIVSRTDADFWSQLQATLRALVGDAPEHSVVVNRHAGIVAVRALPETLRDVAEYLEQVERTVTRQVILEAKVIEVELSGAYQAGINWAAVLRDGNKTFFGGQATPPNGFGSDLLDSAGRPINVTPGNPVTGFASRTLGGAFTLAVDLQDISAFIDLLKLQGNARVLSSPRVATLHNQKAIIKAGTDEFFVTGVASNVT
ncbi:MAG: secretin N-terminal domain-containing protein, partial [Gammaproteobacteria bacterium]|nr:secretin N-terminal domain-containing protein [Gammaproteobacteria bacterium]